MNDLQEKYKDQVDFLGVYISEAHAQNEWPLGVKFCITQPKELHQRLEIANKFVNDYNFKIPMLVDTMGNQFETTFAAWPERFYIVDDGKLYHIAEPSNEFGFDRMSISASLYRLFKSRK